MPQQVYKKPAPQVTEREARDMAADDAEVQAAQSSDTEILDETDALLDEIDELLEVNAEEFVASYIQKGGQ